MEKIKSILKVSDQGVSRPFLCKDERDAVRWCKGNHTGIRSLIAEWMCARMYLIKSTISEEASK